MVKGVREISLDGYISWYVDTFGNFPRDVYALDKQEQKKRLKTCFEQEKPYEDIFMTKEEREEWYRLLNDPDILFDG